MKFTKAKTAEFRFNITDLIPEKNTVQTYGSTEQLYSYHGNSRYMAIHQDAGKKFISNRGVALESKSNSQMAAPQNVRTGYKVLLGNGRDGAALDLDTFLRVQQWVEDVKVQSEWEITGTENQTVTKDSTFSGGKDS